MLTNTYKSVFNCLCFRTPKKMGQKLLKTAQNHEIDLKCVPEVTIIEPKLSKCSDIVSKRSLVYTKVFSAFKIFKKI